MGTKPGERMMVPPDLSSSSQTPTAAAGGDDIRGVQLARCCKHAFGTMGTKGREQMMGRLEWWAETTSGEFNSQNVANTQADPSSAPPLQRQQKMTCRFVPLLHHNV